MIKHTTSSAQARPAASLQNKHNRRRFQWRAMSRAEYVRMHLTGDLSAWRCTHCGTIARNKITAQSILTGRGRRLRSVKSRDKR